MVKEDMIILGLKLLVICYVLSDLAQFIGELIDMVVLTKNKLLGVIKSLLVYLLTCNKCFSFWASLIWSGDLFIAASIGLLMGLIKHVTSIMIYKINNI